MSGQPHIRRLPMQAAYGWLMRGGDLLGRGGVALVRIAAVLLLISMVQLLPLIGVLVLILITPALTAGLLNVFRALEQQQGASVDQLLVGLGRAETRLRLLGLGGLLLLGTLAALAVLFGWLAPQMDLAALAEWSSDPAAVNQDPEAFLALFDGVNVVGGLVLGMLLMLLVLGALFFAVPLVFFWNWPLLVALLWALRALWVNWRAMLAYVLLFGLFSGLVTLALGTAGGLLVQVLTLMLSMFVQLLLAAAQWRAFGEVFPPPDQPAVHDDHDRGAGLSA
ncbi:MAG: hypothetical protein RQ729_05895 [Wenzhouxiangellaceae bacterium]|nr:hypothetical protein [Wenzhouxiangellaceae bacterium]